MLAPLLFIVLAGAGWGEEAVAKSTSSVIELLKRARSETGKASLNRLGALHQIRHREVETKEEFRALLQTAHNTQDKDLAEAAARGLARVKKEATYLKEDYRPLLRDGNFWLRVAACSALGTLKDKESKDDIVRLLDDKQACAIASMALAEIGDPSVIPEMIKRAGDHQGESLLGLDRFGAAGAKAMVDELKKGWVLGPKGEARKRLLQVLSMSRNPEAKAVLMPLKNDKDKKLRAAVLEALAFMGDDTLIQDYVAQLSDSDIEVVFSAMTALANLQTDAALEKLNELLLTHPNGDIRSGIAARLAYRGEASNLPALEKAAKEDKSKRVRMAATSAIQAIRTGFNSGNRHHPNTIRERPHLLKK